MYKIFLMFCTLFIFTRCQDDVVKNERKESSAEASSSVEEKDSEEKLMTAKAFSSSSRGSSAEKDEDYDAHPYGHGHQELSHLSIRLYRKPDINKLPYERLRGRLY